MSHYERYMAFHAEWHKELLSGDYPAFERFRMDYPKLSAFVADHAFALWMQISDKWPSIEEFAANYASAIELGQGPLFGDKVATWTNHGRLVQNLMVGA